LGEEHHCDAFAAALGVPDDAAFLGTDVGLGGFDAEVLVDARKFFAACVEKDKIIDEFEEARFVAEFEKIFVEFIAGIVFLVFFPCEEVFGFGADGAVAESFGVVAC